MNNRRGDVVQTLSDSGRTVYDMRCFMWYLWSGCVCECVCLNVESQCVCGYIRKTFKEPINLETSAYSGALSHAAMYWILPICKACVRVDACIISKFQGEM